MLGMPQVTRAEHKEAMRYTAMRHLRAVYLREHSETHGHAQSQAVLQFAADEDALLAELRDDLMRGAQSAQQATLADEAIYWSAFCTEFACPGNSQAVLDQVLYQVCSRIEDAQASKFYVGISVDLAKRFYGNPLRPDIPSHQQRGFQQLHVLAFGRGSDIARQEKATIRSVRRMMPTRFPYARFENIGDGGERARPNANTFLYVVLSVAETPFALDRIVCVDSQ